MGGSGVALRVGRLTAADLSAATALCARGMQDNPLHRRIYGANSARRVAALTCFFRHLLGYQLRRGLVFGTWRGERLIAVFGLMPPGACRPGPWQALRLLPALCCLGTPARLLLTLRWLIVWRRHDPLFPHWHLGPLVVAPELQGSGAGPRLVQRALAQLHLDRAEGWLETDKPANVRLYEKMGFRVVARTTVAGVPNWFMRGALPQPRRLLRRGER